LSAEVSISGRNTGEDRESERRIDTVRIGAVRSATAYQRTSTRHRTNLDPMSRRPALPWTRLVIRMPAVIGPISRRTPANSALPEKVARVVPKKPAGPTTIKMRPQEMANTSE
jgi:hypothetical protein